MSAVPATASKPPRNWGGWLLGGASALTYAYLYLPIFIVILYSFSKARVQVWPIEGFSLDWYRELLDDSSAWEALWLSVRVALVASLLAVLIGTLGALALDRVTFRGKQAIRFMILLPITLPGIVTGIALLSAWALLDRPIAMWTTEIFGLTFPWPMILAHATFCITLVLNSVIARLGQLPRYLGEASADLGATPWTTFRTVTFPLIAPAIISGAILAFTLSFDEVVVSLFLKGRESTLPLWIYGKLRQDFSPEINAMATIITLVSLVGIVLSTLLVRGNRQQGSAS